MLTRIVRKVYLSTKLQKDQHEKLALAQQRKNNHRFFCAWIFLFSTAAFAEEKILIVAAEQTGVFNTGGLGHTVEGLAKALKKDNASVEVLMPYYSDIDPDLQKKFVRESPGFLYSTNWGFGDFSTPYYFELYSYIDPESDLKTYLFKQVGDELLFDNKRLPGESKRYATTPQLEGKAFAIFNKMAARFIMKGRYSLINLHDWHSGLVGYYMNEDILPTMLPQSERRVLFTISNFGYQGVFDPDSIGMGRPDDVYFKPERFEFFNKLNFMKGGILYADHVLTVSQNYLNEMFDDRYGGGLSGFLKFQQKRRPFSAITNGGKTDAFRPTDYDADHLEKKTELKNKLLNEYHLNQGQDVFVLTSRLANQKGFDYLPDAIEKFILKNTAGVFFILGDGEPRYVEKITELVRKYPERIVYSPFNSDFEKRLMFAGDFFVNTPWYEPSGTNQMYALRAGTIPILSRVGGLPEYIDEDKTGFLVNVDWKDKEIDRERTARSIADGFERAVHLKRNAPEKFSKMIRDAMAIHHDWSTKMPAYRQLMSGLRENQSVAFEKFQKDCFRSQLKLLDPKPVADVVQK